MEREEIFVTKSSMPPYQEYIEAIKPLWDSHCLTNMGKYHQVLEEKLCQYLDVPELSLMVNGHMALELAIQAMEFPEGGEIITTPFTFISTTHAIVRNHLKPVFCDVKLCDGTIDETKLEDLITEKTVAIVPVHVYGNVCNVDEIQRIADGSNLKVIYDAAHAFGVKYKGIGIGNYGDMSMFSFHATKVFHTIEGGAVTFSGKKFYDKLYNMKNFGIRDEELVADIGANAKMNEFSAIMGLCNLKHINSEIKKREERFYYYKERIADIKGVECLEGRRDSTGNFGYFPIIVTERYPLTRDELFNRLKTQGINTRKYFYPLTSEQACFRNKYKKSRLENAKYLAKHILVLPIYADLSFKVIDRICQMLRNR